MRCAQRCRARFLASARGNARYQAPRKLKIWSDEERPLQRVARGGRITALEIATRPIGIAFRRSPFGSVFLAGPRGFEGGNRSLELAAGARFGRGAVAVRALQGEPPA